MNGGIEGTTRDQAHVVARERTGEPDAAGVGVEEAGRAAVGTAMPSTISAPRTPGPPALGRVAPGEAAAWVAQVAEAWVADAAWAEARQAGEA